MFKVEEVFAVRGRLLEVLLGIEGAVDDVFVDLGLTPAIHPFTFCLNPFVKL